MHDPDSNVTMHPIILSNNRHVLIENCTFGARKPWQVMMAIETLRKMVDRWFSVIMLLFMIATLVDIYAQYERIQSQRALVAKFNELSDRLRK